MDIYFNSGYNTGMLFNDELTTKIGVMAAKIAYHNFAWRYVTLIMSISTDPVGLDPFLMNYNRSVVVTQGRFTPLQRAIDPQFVLFAEESEMENIITWIAKDGYDRTKKFILVCASHSQECDERRIFKGLVKHFIVNVILLKLSRESNEPLAYTYHILLPGKCINAEPVKMNLINNCKNDECFKSVYPEKLAEFHGCQFIVSTIYQPPFMFLHKGTKKPSGIDGDIVRFVTTVLNASLVVKTPEDGIGHHINHKWTGSFDDVYYNRAHASVCSTPLTAIKYGNFQTSFPYNSMDIVWVARLPALKPPWNRLLDPLSFHVRIAILFTFISIVIMDILRKTGIWAKIRKVLMIEPPKYSLIFYSWMTFLGLPLLRISKQRSFVIMVFAWIWFCFLMRNAYQAALINSLKQKGYEDKSENFNHVLQSGSQYGGPPTFREYYRDDRNIYENWIHLELGEVKATLEAMSNGSSSFVLALTQESINYYLTSKNHIKKYGERSLQIIPDKIVSSPLVMYFKKHSPLIKPVNRILQVAFESGFVERAYRRYHVEFERARRRHEAAEPLTLTNFAGSLSLLTLGFFVSTIYFVVELICGYLKRN